MTTGEPPGMGRGTESLRQANRVFDTLSDARRRYILHYLHEYDARADIRDLVDYIVDMAPNIDADDRESVVIDLHHYHLPKLSEFGFIEYNYNTGSVRYLSDALLDECLKQAHDADLG